MNTKSNLLKSIFISLILLMGVSNAWGSDPHFYLNGKTTKIENYYGQDSKYSIYVWMTTNSTFYLNNGSNNYGPNSNNTVINANTTGASGTYNSNKWKYTGATGLVRICVDQASNEWYPSIWVEEMGSILTGNDIMFYYGDTWDWGTKYLNKSKSNDYKNGNAGWKLSSTYCTVVRAAAGQKYWISNNNTWQGVQMSNNAAAGALYSLTNNNGNKINVTSGKIPEFSTTAYAITVGTATSGISATVNNTSSAGRENTLYYYYSTDGGNSWIGFDVNDVDELTEGEYQIAAIACDGFICVKSSNTATLTINPNTYSYTVTAGEGGTVSPASGTVAQGSGVTITATPHDGYEFNKWTATNGTLANANSASTTFTPSANNANATASFKVAGCTQTPTTPTSLTAKVGGNALAGAVCSGTNVTLTAGGSISVGSLQWGTGTVGKNIITEGNGRSSITVSPAATTTYWVRSIITEAGVCYGVTSDAKTLQVSITPALVQPVLSKSTLTLEEGGSTGSITVTSGTTGGTWTSSDQNVATVNNGTVTPVGPGTATITYTVSNGCEEDKTATCTVTVNAKPYYIAGRLQQNWNTSSKTQQFTYVSNGQYKYETRKTVAELSVGWSADNNYLQYFFIHTGSGLSNSFTSSNNNGHNFHQKLGYANALTLSSNSTDGEKKFIKFADTSDKSSDVVIWWEPSTKKLWYTAQKNYKITYGVGNNKGTDAVTTTPSITSESLVLASTEITFSKGDTKEGYTWKNWNNKADGTGTNLGEGDTYVSSNRTGDISVYACYDLITYNITYNLNGGTGATNTTYNVESATITLPTTPTKTGYTFSGWYDNEGCTGEPITTIPQGSTEDKTFYAQWTANTYTVVFDANGGVGEMANQDFTYDVEQALTANAFTRTGYTFTGWNTNANGSGTAYNDGQSAQNLTAENEGTVTLYAQWEEILSTITIIVSEGGKVTVDGEDFVSGNTVQVGVATTKKVTAVPNDGYGVATWGVSNREIVNISGANTVTLKSDGSGSTGTLYANFIGLEYTITFDKQSGSDGTDKATVRYMGNEYSVNPVEAPTRTGYTFGGYYSEEKGAGEQVVSAEGQWLANATGYTDADRKWLVKENTTLYAQWTANTYTVTLDQEGAAEKGDASVSATYNADMPEIAQLPTAKEGYGFMGYWDGKDGAGTQYYNADGTSARAWDKADNATLYAYFVVPQIDVTLDKSTFEPGAENVTATATVTPTPAGTTTICWELLYTNNNPVENHAPTPETGNSVQFNISDLATGTYKIKATLRKGNGCGGDEISSSEQQFLISSSHTITIKYICDGKEIQSKTTIEANVSSTTTTKAPDIVGYTFSNWEAGDGVTITGTNGKEVTFTAIFDGYLTAKYTKNSSIIYFYNTLGWENVYVYFYNDANGYNYWTDNYGTGAHQNKDFGSWDRKPFWEMEHGQMQQIEGTNIWYFQMTNKRSKVAFASVNQTHKEGDNVSNTTAYFQGAEVVYRDDLDSEGRLPMFVPNPTISHDMTNTKSKYYNKGYWMNYPENTGYTLDLFNHHSDNDPARYYIYPYSKNTIFPLQLEVEINAENIVDGAKKIWFRIHRNDGKDFGGHATNFPTVNPTTTGGFIAENDYKVVLITPIAGTYTFTLDYKYNEKTKDYQYHIEVDYPAKVGDYRILYRDEAETNWSGNTKPVGWYHPSRVIKKGEDRKDIISFYINKDVERSLSYQTIKSINNETGAITWDTEEVPFMRIDWPQITKSGVYNFTFVQDGDGISVENDIVPYEGNYYIRTDAMGGGWEDYKTNSENRMTYSSFSESVANSFGEKFSHYATKWCEAGTNVKFTIANDYSHCISDTLAQDVIPLGNLTDEGTLLNNDIYDANIRFMWNRKTNKISRAYVGPTGDKQSQFLMLQSCSEFKDAVGNDLDPNEGDILDKENDIYAARFTDTQNWIYERTIQVKTRTRVKLYASYPNGYHIYIENNTGWKDVALYAFKDGGGEPLGNWPGIQPTRTVEIEGKTYYDFPVNKYVFGSNLIFNDTKKGTDGGQQKDDYQIQTIGDYYLTASSSNSQLSRLKFVSTTVEAKAQYFRGVYDTKAYAEWDNTNSIQILGGNSEEWYTMRIIYDFKTNRLMAAWVPDQDINGTLEIDADIMVIRQHQDDATCITFASNQSALTEVKTVYGVMRFNRWILNNRGGADNLDIKSCTKVVDNQTVYDPDTTNQYHPILEPAKQTSQYERALYFISFPFDVHLSDVFGFGTYGQHWIIEYYDGLKRAKEGYWIDSDPNWKYVTDPSNFVLEKYKGYILCLNLGKMAYDNTDFWAHNISQVELFFPSVTTMEEISKIEVTMPALGEEYLCKINRGDGTEGDRRVKDSYWRCIGVPSYANYSNVLKDEEGNDIRWQTSYTTFPFLYAWNTTDNTLTPQSTSNFQFKTMHAYLVQNGGEIHWSAVNATPKPSNIVAKQQAESKNYEWRLTLTRNEQVEDQAFIRLSNDKKITNNFDFGQDLSKEFNYGRSDIYTLIGYEKAAANSLPISEQTTVIPLGLSIEYNGDYTLAMPDRVNGIGVTLVDNQTGTRTNLSAGMDYTLTLNKGDYNNRFFIEISPVQQVPTDIEYVTGDTNGKDTVRKVLIDNILYIVRDGQIFDARGVRVQ